MRIVVTGAGGFVGPHVVAALQAAVDAEVIGTGFRAEPAAAGGEHVALDITDAPAVTQLIADLRPSHIVHLAAISAPLQAAADHDLTWRVNVGGTLNLARAILDSGTVCTLLNVGSGMVYGATAMAGLPLDEASLPAPLDEYAATKAAADLALGAMVRRGLSCVRLRPFNHTGRGQTESFVVPAFAMQIARIEAGLAPPVVRVGNLEAERDFLDVRDVARAYALAVARARQLPAGIILNIASGVPRRTSEILRRLLNMSRVPITVEQDPSRMRPSDIPRMIGASGRAHELLDWQPRHDFEETLGDVLEDCRQRVGKVRSSTTS